MDCSDLGLVHSDNQIVCLGGVNIQQDWVWAIQSIVTHNWFSCVRPWKYLQDWGVILPQSLLCFKCVWHLAASECWVFWGLTCYFPSRRWLSLRAFSSHGILDLWPGQGRNGCPMKIWIWSKIIQRATQCQTPTIWGWFAPVLSRSFEIRQVVATTKPKQDKQMFHVALGDLCLGSCFMTGAINTWDDEWIWLSYFGDGLKPVKTG
jgi:hypothetical protein